MGALVANDSQWIGIGGGDSDTRRFLNGESLDDLEPIQSGTDLHELHLRVATLNLTLSALRLDLDRVMTA